MSKKADSVVDPMEIAISELLTLANSKIRNEHDILQQKILDFNQSVLKDRKELITMYQYAPLFRKHVFPDIDLIHMSYFLNLCLEPTFINADVLGPRRFGLLSIKAPDRYLNPTHIENLLEQYDFVKNNDYYIKQDVSFGKTKRDIVMISPRVLEICLTCATTIGYIYRNYYFFLETVKRSYSQYKKEYTINEWNAKKARAMDEYNKAMIEYNKAKSEYKELRKRQAKNTKY